MATKESKAQATFSAKAMLKENGEKGTKFFYADRLEVEIVQETRHYKVGQKIKPHKVMAEALVKQGIAKLVK